MNRLLIINLFISLLWPTLNGDYSLLALFTGFALGFAVLTIVKRSYGKLIFSAIAFLFYVLWDIVQSNLKLAGLVLATLVGSTERLRPAIVAVPLTITGSFARTLLASVITLTPGTLSVDLGRRDGQDVLFVHTIDLADAESLRRDIKTSFEDRILQMYRLQAELADDEEMEEAGR